MATRIIPKNQEESSIKISKENLRRLRNGYTNSLSFILNDREFSFTGVPYQEEGTEEDNIPENPFNEHLYELDETTGFFSLTLDTAPSVIYTPITSFSVEDNPLENLWYEFKNENYEISEDTTVNTRKTYYERVDKKYYKNIVGLIYKKYDYLKTILTIKITINDIFTETEEKDTTVEIILFEDNDEYQLKSGDSIRFDWSIDNSISLRKNQGYIKTADEKPIIYIEADSDANDNPVELGWYELNDEVYILSQDETVMVTVSAQDISEEGINPYEEGWYEYDQNLEIYVLTLDQEVQEHKQYYKDNGKTYFKKQEKQYYLQEKLTNSDSNFIRLDKYGLYGIDNLSTGGTYVPANIEEVKERAAFSLTWDGYTLRTIHPNGNGKIEIGSKSDIVVYDNNDTIALIGYLDEALFPEIPEYTQSADGNSQAFNWDNFSTNSITQQSSTSAIKMHTSSYNLTNVYLDNVEINSLPIVNPLEYDGAPQDFNWYEIQDDFIVPSEDTEIIEGKLYFNNLSGLTGYYFEDKKERIFIYNTPLENSIITIVITPVARKIISGQYGIYSKNFYVGDNDNYLAYYKNGDKSSFVIRTDDFSFQTDIQGQRSIREILSSTYNRVDEMQPLYRSLNSWIAVGEMLDSDGSTPVTLQIADYTQGGANSSEIRITSKKISFWEGGIEAAYIKDHDFNIDNGFINYKLQFGKYAFIKRNNGENLSLKYLG